MGRIRQLQSRYGKAIPTGMVGSDDGSRLWRQIFGVAGREERIPDDQRQKPVPGGAWGRSSTATGAAFKRLLQAMRSMAPGGWSDDRYEETRHFVGIAYVAIHHICLQLQQATFQVYRKTDKRPEGKVPVERGEDGYRLVELLEKPNPQDSFGKLMYRWGQQRRLTGTALTWMVPNMNGTPMELYSIPTAIAVPQPAINPDFPDGYYRIQPLYPYGPFSSYPTPATAVGAPIPAQWMMRMVYPHPFLRYEGYSPLTGLRLEMDEFEMIGKSRHYSMRRSVNPSAVLNFADVEGIQPLPRPEIERIHAEWENEFQGPENHGRLIVGAPGGKLEPWGQRPVDMDYQSGWEQLSSFILGGFGITKPAAGMIENSSYATLFATLKQLHEVTLEPECCDIGSELTRRLAPFFGDDLIVEVKCKRIDDHDVALAKANALMAAQAITKNEFRQMVGEIVTTEPWGKELAGTPPAQPGMEGGGGAPPGMEGGAQGGDQELASMLLGGAPVNEEPGGELRHEPEPDELALTRPKPRKLAEGSLGPQKGLTDRLSKRLKSLPPRKTEPVVETESFYDKVNRACLNGYH